ncbi:hypothetical protein KIW84_044647 [Lathyrus oleraceus]|uniref:Uncharacterized protein n=1 Tax=Pisum sativum TaxID=3888 RepID=A0A9D4XKQ7_PEA|nr:hypothetical protein KIW84_044647 [Pisum sativum]
MEICFWVMDSISSEEDGDLFVDYGFISREEEEKAYLSYLYAGRNGIHVRLHGHEFGKASGMSPRARIAV